MDHQLAVKSQAVKSTCWVSSPLNFVMLTRSTTFPCTRALCSCAKHRTDRASKLVLAESPQSAPLSAQVWAPQVGGTGFVRQLLYQRSQSWCFSSDIKIS